MVFGFPRRFNFYTKITFFVALLSTTLFGAVFGESITIHYDTTPNHFLAIRGNGNGLSWEQGATCQSSEENCWIWQKENLVESMEFKVLLDDQYWCVGANFEIKPGENLEIYPFFNQEKGTLHKISNFWSPEFQNHRTLRIYLPPSYFENRFKSYPVLYAQDGQNLFEAETAAFGVEWQFDETLNALIFSGKVAEIIVVGIDNMGQDRIFEYTSKSEDPRFRSGGSSLYMKFLLETILPFVESHYRTKKGPENTALIGSSLGGLISLEIGWKHFETFGKIASLSGSFWWNNSEWQNKIANETQNLISQHRKEKLVLYLDAGTAQDGLPQTQELANLLNLKGYKAHLYVAPGASHQEFFWAKRLWRPLTYLFPFHRHIWRI